MQFVPKGILSLSHTHTHTHAHKSSIWMIFIAVDALFKCHYDPHLLFSVTNCSPLLECNEI